VDSFDENQRKKISGKCTFEGTKLVKSFGISLTLIHASGGVYDFGNVN
jgi:hypothetical protein